MAASSRNPCHLLAGANDYRTVDLPGVTARRGNQRCVDRAIQVRRRRQHVATTLCPAIRRPTALNGLFCPRRPPPTGVRAGTNGLFYYRARVRSRRQRDQQDLRRPLHGQRQPGVRRLRSSPSNVDHRQRHVRHLPRQALAWRSTSRGPARSSAPSTGRPSRPATSTPSTAASSDR